VLLIVVVSTIFIDLLVMFIFKEGTRRT